MKFTWLSPSKKETKKEFLESVYEQTKAAPGPFVATAIPIGGDGKLTMLHIVAGTQDGDLTEFSDLVIRQFATLAAQVIGNLNHSEMESAQQALNAREIGALSAASRNELAVVVGTPDVAAVQKRIAALQWD